MTRNTHHYALLLVGIALFILVQPSLGAGREGGLEAPHSGKFLLYVADTLVGHEEFRFGPEGAFSKVSLSMGQIKIDMETELYGQPGSWKSYRLTAGPQVLTAEIGIDEAILAAPGLQKKVSIGSPAVVVENNVFFHYQLLLYQYGVIPQGLKTYKALVPSALTAAEYGVELMPDRTDGYLEYWVSLSGVRMMQIHAEADGNIAMISIPAQRMVVLREGVPEREAKQPDGQASMHTDIEFEVANGGIVLSGTLTIPAGANGPVPAVLLNSGSGPQDRDGNTAPVYMPFMFKHMAARFADAGIAVLRYDERGVGKSTGDYDSATLTDLISDVVALTQYLKAHPSIDARRLGLLGHSEGVSIVTAVAAEDPSLACLVLMAGPSKPLDFIMVEQLEYQANHPDLDEASRALVAQIMPMVLLAIEDAKAGKPSTVMGINTAWLAEHMAFDPSAVIAKTPSPILILQGGKDLKVKAYHADELASAAKRGGNKDVTVVLFPTLGHEFTEFAIGNPRFDPMDPLRIPDEVYDTIRDWLAKRLRADLYRQ